MEILLFYLKKQSWCVAYEAIIPKKLLIGYRKKKLVELPSTDPLEKNTPVKGKYSSKYILSGIMMFAKCRQPYGRQIWKKMV
jgi:hypothetical protein